MTNPIVVHTYYPDRATRKRGTDSEFERWYKGGRKTGDATPRVNWANLIKETQAELDDERERVEAGHGDKARVRQLESKLDRLREGLSQHGEDRVLDGPLSAWLHEHGLIFAPADKARDAPKPGWQVKVIAGSGMRRYWYETVNATSESEAMALVRKARPGDHPTEAVKAPGVEGEYGFLDPSVGPRAKDHSRDAAYTSAHTSREGDQWRVVLRTKDTLGKPVQRIVMVDAADANTNVEAVREAKRRTFDFGYPGTWTVHFDRPVAGGVMTNTFKTEAEARAFFTASGEKYPAAVFKLFGPQGEMAGVHRAGARDTKDLREPPLDRVQEFYTNAVKSAGNRVDARNKTMQNFGLTTLRVDASGKVLSYVMGTL